MTNRTPADILNVADDYTVIHSESIYGARTKQPLVKLSWEEKTMMVTTGDAKRIAYDLLDTAHASDGDAFIFDWLSEKLNIDINRAAMVLKEFRDYRIMKNGEN